METHLVQTLALANVGAQPRAETTQNASRTASLGLADAWPCRTQSTRNPLLTPTGPPL